VGQPRQGQRGANIDGRRTTRSSGSTQLALSTAGMLRAARVRSNPHCYVIFEWAAELHEFNLCELDFTSVLRLFAKQQLGGGIDRPACKGQETIALVCKMLLIAPKNQ
jgi:hypothetical protein